MTSETAPSDPVESSRTIHQERNRIITELEQLFATMSSCTTTSAGGTPGRSGLEAELSLPVQSIENYLTYDLGYADQDEFEDALEGSFSDFLKKLPNCEVWSATDGVEHFRLRPRAKQPPRVLKLRVENSEQVLGQELLFAPAPAKIAIPEAEFEIQGADKPVRDTLYQHLATAIANLEQHAAVLKRSSCAAASGAGAGGEPGLSKQASDVLVAVDELRGFLDVEQPFTFEVHDPEGACLFFPEEGVELEEMKE